MSGILSNIDIEKSLNSVNDNLLFTPHCRTEFRKLRSLHEWGR